MLCMVWLSWYWEGRKGFSVIERDCYWARSSLSSLDLWSPPSGRKNPPTRATGLMPTGKVVTTVRQARVNHQVRFTNTRDRVIHYLCKWSDEAKINESDPLMNFYSDSILQIMTLYVRDTGKISIYFLVHSKQLPALHPSIMLLILPKGLGAVETHIISGIILLKAGVSLHASPPL